MCLQSQQLCKMKCLLTSESSTYLSHLLNLLSSRRTDADYFQLQGHQAFNRKVTNVPFVSLQMY